MSSALRFSVIIPLEFHRGQAVTCVRAWAKEQGFPRDRFEIVIASPVGHPSDELDEIRGLLAPQDRLVEFDDHHDMDLCAKAADIARGDVLFFTESHCVPEPETLAGADAVIDDNPQWAGFSCRSVPVTGNFLSEIEADWYARDIDYGMNEHPWRKVLDQCFVVHRSAYFEAGGFDPAFGHFAEWLIAARLYALGMKIGYAPDVRVSHVYIGDFRVWHEFTADFIQGQMAYLALEPEDPLSAMFDDVPEWTNRQMLQRTVARRVWWMLVQDLRRSTETRSAAAWHWPLLKSWTMRALAGHSRLLLRAQRRFVTTRAALEVDLLTRNRARADAHLTACCAAIATAERARFLRAWSRNRPSVGHQPTSDAGRWDADALDGARAIAFHAASSHGEDRVRWSEPAAYVELPLAAGRHVIRLGVHPAHFDVRSRVRFSLDERPIPPGDVRVHPDLIELRVDVSASTHPPRLGWVCPPNRADRRLGLPIVSVEWVRESQPALSRVNDGTERPARSAAATRG